MELAVLHILTDEMITYFFSIIWDDNLFSVVLTKTITNKYEYLKTQLIYSCFFYNRDWSNHRLKLSAVRQGGPSTSVSRSSTSRHTSFRAIFQELIYVDSPIKLNSRTYMKNLCVTPAISYYFVRAWFLSFGEFSSGSYSLLDDIV